MGFPWRCTTWPGKNLPSEFVESVWRAGTAIRRLPRVCELRTNLWVKNFTRYKPSKYHFQNAATNSSLDKPNLRIRHIARLYVALCLVRPMTPAHHHNSFPKSFFPCESRPL